MSPGQVTEPRAESTADGGARARGVRRARTALARLRERVLESRGSMTILTTGVLVVILMVIGVGTAITGVQLERNGLQHAADSAALAASQAVDPSRIYDAGGRRSTPGPRGTPPSSTFAPIRTTRPAPRTSASRTSRSTPTGPCTWCSQPARTRRWSAGSPAAPAPRSR